MFKADRRSKQVQLCDLSRTIKCLLVLAVFAFGILVPVTVLNAQGDESGATVISQPTQILADILLNGLDEDNLGKALSLYQGIGSAHGVAFAEMLLAQVDRSGSIGELGLDGVSPETEMAIAERQIFGLGNTTAMESMRTPLQSGLRSSGSSLVQVIRLELPLV